MREYGILKQEPGVNVTDDLRRVRQLRLQQSQLRLRIRGGGNGGSADQNLIEGGRRFGNRHGVILHHGGMREHLLVVERMTKLVRQRYHIREGAGEICQHAALPDGGNAAVKGTSDLPGTREEINPCLVEGALHHVM